MLGLPRCCVIPRNNGGFLFITIVFDALISGTLQRCFLTYKIGCYDLITLRPLRPPHHVNGALVLDRLSMRVQV